MRLLDEQANKILGWLWRPGLLFTAKITKNRERAGDAVDDEQLALAPQ